MYITLPDKSCSKCGSLNNEQFIQKSKRGIRCLQCGHEYLENNNSHVVQETSAWVADSSIEYF